MATRKPKTAKPTTEETGDMIVVQEASNNGKKIFKPHGEEFTLDGDFNSIAVALNLQIEAIEFSIEDDSADGIDGKSLVGRAK